VGIRRRVTAACVTVALGLTLAGCTEQPSTAAAPNTPAVASLIATGAVPSVVNDLATNSAHHTLKVDGEQFSLNADYWTEYDAAAWQTLQPKKVNLSVHLVPAASTAGDPPEVLIGSFSGITTLLAAMPGLDGSPIAVSNQEPNAIPGYLITENFPYDNALAIEGFSDALSARWAMVAGEQPLTGARFGRCRCVRQSDHLSYRLLVKNTGDAGYHQRILQDTLTMTVLASPAPAANGSAAATTPAG